MAISPIKLRVVVDIVVVIVVGIEVGVVVVVFVVVVSAAAVIVVFSTARFCKFSLAVVIYHQRFVKLSQSLSQQIAYET